MGGTWSNVQPPPQMSGGSTPLPAPISIGLPSIAAVVLGLIAGTLQVLNQVVFDLSSQWHAFLAIMLVFLAAIGISPLVGAQFRAALHLPPWAGYLIGAGLSAVMVAITSVHMDVSVAAVLGAIITIASALGFAPAVVTVEVARHLSGRRPIWLSLPVRF